MYKLDELIEKFTKHAEQTDKDMEVVKKRWKEQNGGEEMPEYLSDDFNLPRALLTLCKEIKKLQGWHDG